MPRVSKYRIQGLWIIVLIFVLANYYWWLKTPFSYFLSPVYWSSYIAWALVGGWGLLPKKLGVSDQSSRLSPLWIGISGLTMFLATRAVPALALFSLGFAGFFGGMALRSSIYLVGRLILPERKRASAYKKEKPSPAHGLVSSET